MGIGPLPVTWYENTLEPDKKTAFPLALMQVKWALLLLLFLKKISPSLPPQPLVVPSTPFKVPDCHSVNWSLCENSLGGKSPVCAAVNWALVVGLTNGPTFKSTPRWPALNKFATSLMAD